MCHEPDSSPPIPRITGAAVAHEDVVLEAADGNRFAAFAASPDEPSGAGIVILPDVRGLYRFYEELALRFAERGHMAVAIEPVHVVGGFLAEPTIGWARGAECGFEELVDKDVGFCDRRFIGLGPGLGLPPEIAGGDNASRNSARAQKLKVFSGAGQLLLWHQVRKIIHRLARTLRRLRPQGQAYETSEKLPSAKENSGPARPELIECDLSQLIARYGESQAANPFQNNLNLTQFLKRAGKAGG